MKSPLKTLVWLPASLIVAAFSLNTLSGCQESPTPKITEITGTHEEIASNDQNVAVNSHNNQDSSATTVNTQNTDTIAQSAAPIAESAEIPNSETMPLSTQQPRGTQVTDVHYRSAAGETLSVVFQTSATGVLNAVITLSNDAKMALSAPEGQGNNPTYRSADGKIELVSHQGGTVIDLIRNDTVTSFTATSAKAEVITQT
ncbi:hypothetical protein [Psychrobacter sp. 16-MNA-CIBAN-0192]|uniref:hypothetical protein n=1 Tax=Psychrobacter sp. 16-MNA-CIBAN-0192 TaxID=3140448 RepID=UPI00331DD9A3